MDMQIQLVATTLLMPMFFSFLLKLMMVNKVLKNIDYAAVGILVVWLVPYLWIVGLPSLPPSEAIQWIGLLGIAFVIYSSLSNTSRNTKTAVQTIFMLASFILLIWPVLISLFSAQLLVELMAVSLTGLIIFKRLTNISQVNATMSLGVSNAGIAVVTSLGASLLLGQLATALVASLSAFIVYEWFKKMAYSRLTLDAMHLLIFISLSLLLIARIYAEIPLISALLLLVSLLVGLSSNWRYATWLSVLATVASILYLLLTSDGSSYY